VAVLCVIGDLLEDVVVWLDQAPRPGTDTPARIVRTRGGSAANVAAFAALAGERPRFIGAIGDDVAGQRLADLLEAGGVDARLQRVPAPTGTVVVLVDPDGERTMLPDRGAATALAAVPDEWLAGCTWLHVPAYSLAEEPLAGVTVRAAAAVRLSGGHVSVDASSVGTLAAGGRGLAEAILALEPEVLFATVEELAMLGGEPSSGWTVVKDGPRPVRAWSVDAGELVVEVDAVDAGRRLDTTGAGDAFAAGVLVALDRGAPMAAAIEEGVALARRAVVGAGAVLGGSA
jgi:sugar/nucleoside kinase (ribokinase family)